MAKPSQLWMWRHFAVELPADWEMLQFSKSMDSGRCAFADRYQYRFELNWRRVGGRPDFDRTLSDYRSKLDTEHVMTGIADVRQGEWRGLEGAMKNGKLSSRFGGYLETEKCFIEAVFLWPGETDRALVHAVLTSLRETVPVNGQFRRWKAFGMDLLTHSDLAMTRCSVFPANAEMFFADPKTGGEEHFSRRGLTRDWLTDSVAAWLTRQTPGRVGRTATHFRTINSHNVEILNGTSRARGMRGLLGRRLNYVACAWLCPADSRLYCSACLAPITADAETLVTAGKRFTCCDRMGKIDK